MKNGKLMKLHIIVLFILLFERKRKSTLLWHSLFTHDPDGPSDFNFLLQFLGFIIVESVHLNMHAQLIDLGVLTNELLFSIHD